MSLFRCRDGEVRLVWKVLITIIVYAAIVFLLRFIPIFVGTAIQSGRGMDRQESIEAFKTIVFEHPIWSTVIGIIHGLMSLPVVWFLIRIIEKRSFAWKDIGLDWRRNSLLNLVLGILLALLMYAGGVVVARVLGFGFPTIKTILAGVTVSSVVLNLALHIPIGFGEEVVFRGYIQTRLVERLGAVRGILIGSIVFTLPHLIRGPLSPVTLLSGVILWAAIGTLYHRSKSLYLVGMFHGFANCLLNILPSEESETAGLIVHVLALLLIGLGGLVLRRKR